ncbi:preprotein translocase subunit YajC [Novosphingobium fuchskuhlense]|uniref:Sec translocon accessory complex subunit YajC n=1 Tax=Novosphingobium fuchskuhlense TaxID=1117702 RepID=A0A124JUC5_9SPHN|nr:preprotein translocase subunit YajC [Novosphingobium fuchskuhlense]KUR71092.1 preprotein translocase subunit YajC [Novosphingobium fuchskuhlense]
MNGSALLTLLAAAVPAATDNGPPIYIAAIPYVGMAAVLYFLILRPQMRRQKEQQAKIAGLKKGDQVVTGGGLIGKVIKVDDTTVDLELGPNVRVRAVRATLGDVLPPGGSAPAND